MTTETEAVTLGDYKRLLDALDTRINSGDSKAQNLFGLVAERDRIRTIVEELKGPLLADELAGIEVEIEQLQGPFDEAHATVAKAEKRFEAAEQAFNAWEERRYSLTSFTADELRAAGAAHSERLDALSSLAQAKARASDASAVLSSALSKRSAIQRELASLENQRLQKKGLLFAGTQPPPDHPAPNPRTAYKNIYKQLGLPMPPK